MSETGDSDEGFENVNHGRGRKRKIIMKIEVDSDEVNTDSGNDSSDSDTNGTRKKQSKCRRNRIVSNENENEVLTGEKAASSGINGTTADSSASDSSSDETLEKCPICLLTFRNQEVASPSTCDHTFCFICLEEWSKNVSTCPIDRLEFKLIAVRKSFSSQKPIRKVAVEGGNVLTEHGNDEDVTNCEICHRPDREDVMLLCDGCNQGYHMYCLTPPLEQVPEGSWYCDHCFESDEEDVEDLNLVYEDLREMGVSESRLRITEVRQPRVPRTRQTERVRARVFARTSGRRMTSENTRAMSTSTNRAGCRKRTKKRRSTRRRRTFVVEYDINNYDEKFAIKTTKRYIRKRRSRKRVKTSKRVNNSRNTVEKLFKAAQRSAVPTTSFSIFGSRNALEYFSDYEDDVETTYSTPSSTSVQTSVRIRNIGSVIRRKNVLAAMDAPVNQNERVDVLSSIMDLQDRWHNVSQNNSSNAVHIGSDGRLTFKETSNKRNTKSNDSSEKLRDAINQAPLYPRGNNPNFSGGGDRYDNYSNNYRNNAGFRNSGGGQYRHSTGIGFGMSAFRRDEGTGQFNRNFSNNIQISPILPDRLRNPQNNRQDRRNANRSTANESLQPTGESSQTAAAGHFESPGACAESQQSMSRDSKSDNYNTVESTSPASNLSSIVPPLAPPPWNKNLFRLAGDYDDDDGGDCPNFSIYSAESLQVARAEPEVSKSSNKGQEDEYEDREEDLVQLGDDDEIPATIESGNRSRNDSTDIYEPEYPTDEIEESENKDENILKSTDDSKVSEDADIPAGSIDEKGSNDLELSNSNIDEFVDKKSGLLDILGESDSEELIDKNTDIQEPSGDDDASEDINDDLSKDLSDEVPIMECENDQQNMQTESISEEEDRSYTPCLDEKIDQDDSTDIRIESHTPPKPPEREMADSDRGEVSTAGIDGMETELISDEDEEILTQDQCVSSSKKKEKDKDESSGKKPRKETFKKISKSTKERNYRGDKERERVKRKSSRSRSKSNDKENENSRRSDRKRIKRKELERYDVRNVIGQPRTYKDRYGRDTSRPPKSRSHTRSRSRRNRTRSRSKLRSRSISSKRNRRSFSISPSPVSYIKSSSLRRSLSSRRSRSKRSRSRRRTPMRRRTRTPLRVRSPSPKPNSKKKKYRQRSLSLSSRSDFRSRSRDFEPRKERSKSLNRSKIKQRKSKDHKKKKPKKRSPSLSLSPEKRSSKPVEYKEPTRKKKRRSKSKTPEQNVWQSNSPQVPVVENDHSWTPPLVPSNAANLTVILKNKDDGKKKDKKKKKDKRREISGKRERRKQRSEVRENPLAPSKEVFASGDNILVSVSFNKDTNAPHPPQQQMTVVTLPPTREEIISKRRSAEKVPKKQKKVKDKAQRKHRKVDSKPVAFIDLERSPFQVIVQSPKDVIILTDSDQELENNREFSNRNLNEEIDSMEPTNGNTQLENVEQCTPIERTEISQEQSFDSSVQQLGPKTPPEPPLIKFSLNPKTKQIKTRNPLHEEQDEIDHEQPEENVEEVEKSSANIIGPNTPPESGPCSPDAYDPFDPTKSPSASPSVPPADEISTPVENDSSPTEDVREARPQVLTAQEKGMNPVDLVMALMNSKPTKSHEICTMNTEQQYAMSSTTDGNDAHEKSDDGTMPKSITVLSNVLIASGKTPSRSTIPTIASPISKPPPAIGGMSQQSIVSKLPLPRTSSNSRQNNGGGTGGIDETVNEIESPYSPGSDDYDDLFEPPPENANSLQHSQRNRGQGKSKSSNKTELFDNLFGNASPVKIPSYTPTTMRKRGNKMHKKTSVKVAKMPGSGKMDEDQIKILDDLPSSAVELQVKDKFLRKLNRQERVVEEVKLVLKPHYTKKHITKDDYKEILRRAVPKICHSRSQEINPKKIQNLIEAYVKKFRQRNKFGILNTGQVSSAVKCAAYLKKL